MNKFCGNCWAKLDNDSVFCQECGAKTEINESIETKKITKLQRKL